jgi:hypothetical protein
VSRNIVAGLVESGLEHAEYPTGSVIRKLLSRTPPEMAIDVRLTCFLQFPLKIFLGNLSYNQLQ